MKILTIAILILLSSCTYDPWRYENYYPLQSSEFQSGYYKSDNDSMKVSIISTIIDEDIREGPYSLWIRYIDNAMEQSLINICDLHVYTTMNQELINNDGACINLPLEIPSLIAGVEPYAKSVLFEHSDMQLNFDEKEKVYVSFSYSLTNQNGNTGRVTEITLLFEPVLEKGLTKPCCLPSV